MELEAAGPGVEEPAVAVAVADAVCQLTDALTPGS